MKPNHPGPRLLGCGLTAGEGVRHKPPGHCHQRRRQEAPTGIAELQDSRLTAAVAMNVSPKPKRRWYQFNLLTLLVVMTVATLAFGGWVQYMRYQAQVNRDRVATSEKAIEKAAARIEELGGHLYTEYDWRRPQTWLEQQFGDPGDPHNPVDVLEATNVYLVSTKTTDADLGHLKELTNLDSLDVSYTKVTDAGLMHLV